MHVCMVAVMGYVEIIVCCDFVVLAVLLACALSWHRSNLDDYYCYYCCCEVKSREQYEGT